jgi:dTDP-4-dehydrorhamnose 3,5-epimerase
MKITALEIDGAWLAESNVWFDQRGFFREWFKPKDIYDATGFDFSSKQANFSVSKLGVVRGIHYSVAPEGQAKWVTCVSGSIIDVVVDIRQDSPTFKKVEYVELTPENGRAVLIGSGLGHGFISKADNSGVAYLLSSEYAPDFELGINPFDAELSIQWDKHCEIGREFTFSEADRKAPSLAESLAKRKSL